MPLPYFIIENDESKCNLLSCMLGSPWRGLWKIAPEFNPIVINFKRRRQLYCLMCWKIVPVYWYSIIKPSQSIKDFSIERPLPFQSFVDFGDYVKGVHLRPSKTPLYFWKFGPCF